jgi:uncharacterized protein YbbC (DUF1343 family)
MKRVGVHIRLVWTSIFLLGIQGIETKFKLGIENINDDFVQRIKSDRIGLITNQTGIDQQGKRVEDLLRARGLKIAYLFAPEHGLDGTADAGEAVTDGVDNKTKIPIISLYGHGNGKMMPDKVIADIDTIMFDVQDSGMRHYTYISTLYHAMKIASQYNKKIIVFDRPNPLGAAMEGPVTGANLKSFISIAQIPLRHGMTVGELAWYFNQYELETAANLHVVKMQGYDRRARFAKGDLDQPLSPGLRTEQACYGYSFLGVLGEIAPFGICLRTDKRFQCVTLPKKLHVSRRLWQQLNKELKSCGIGAMPHWYTDPKSNKKFNGLALQFDDINKVHAFQALYTVLTFFKKQGINFSFSRDFDYAVGTKSLRELLQANKSHTEFAQEVNDQLLQFFSKAKPAFMYDPLPKPMLLR